MQVTRPKKVEIIGVPSDLGANIRGANMGPAAIRIADLKKKIQELGYAEIDRGDVAVPVRDQVPQEVAQSKYLGPIKTICDQVAAQTQQVLEAGNIPVIIGGDHSIGIGTISGASSYFRSQGKKMGLIWVDAHADINTPTSSPSGNIHGMPLSVVLGQGHPELVSVGGPGAKVEPQNVALIAIRTIDALEREQLKKSGITYFTMRDIDEKGLAKVMQESIAAVSKGTDGIHASFDIDGVDPLYAPGVSTPCTGGLSLREAHLIMEMAFETGRLTSMEIVEVNPAHDQGSQTAILAVELILSGLGKSIV
jgi:arginase